MTEQQINSMSDGIKGMQLTLAVRDAGVPVAASTGISSLIGRDFAVDLTDDGPMLKANSGKPLTEAIRESLARPDVAALLPAAAPAAPVADPSASWADQAIAHAVASSKPAEDAGPQYRMTPGGPIMAQALGRNPYSPVPGGARAAFVSGGVSWDGPSANS